MARGSAAQRDAISNGRIETKAVRDYLEMIGTDRRGRRSGEQLQKQLEAVTAELDKKPDPVKRLDLTQQRMNLERRIRDQERFDGQESAVIDAFVAHAKSWADRKGISRAAFLESGVPAKVLNRADIR